MSEKYNTCRHVVKVWQKVVLVSPSCKRYHNIRGTLAVTKKECERCRSWEDKSDDES